MLPSTMLYELATGFYSLHRETHSVTFANGTDTLQVS